MLYEIYTDCVKMIKMRITVLLYTVQDDKPVAWLGDAVAIVDFLIHATSVRTGPNLEESSSLHVTDRSRISLSEVKCHLYQETSKVITANQLNENGQLPCYRPYLASHTAVWLHLQQRPANCIHIRTANRSNRRVTAPANTVAN